MTKNRTHQLDDVSLALLAKSGDRQAFGQLVERWQESLWRFARHFTVDSQSAWDVVQETWMTAARSLHRLEDPNAFKAWVYRIAKRRCIDSQRRVSKSPTNMGDDSDTLSASHPGDDQVRVREAISELSSDQRVILVLHHLEGFSIHDVAGILSIPEGTVKSRLHCARQHLSRILQRKSP